MSIWQSLRRFFAGHPPARPNPAIQGQPTHDDLMAAFNAVVEHTSAVIISEGASAAMDAQEVLAFAMAVTSEIYTLGQGSVARAAPMLDSFHLGVQLMMEQRFRDPQKSRLTQDQADHVMDGFFELLRARYGEYKQTIRHGILQKDPQWFSLCDLMVDRVIDNRLPADDKRALLVPLTVGVALAIITAMGYLLPDKHGGKP